MGYPSYLEDIEERSNQSQEPDCVISGSGGKERSKGGEDGGKDEGETPLQKLEGRVLYLEWIVGRQTHDISELKSLNKLLRISLQNMERRLHRGIRQIQLAQRGQLKKKQAAYSDLYDRYWTELRKLSCFDNVKERMEVLGGAWRISWPSTIPNCRVELIANAKRKSVGVRMVFSDESGQSKFDKLLDRKNEIEGGIGEPLRWNRPSSGEPRIEARRMRSNLEDHASWEEQHSWLARTSRELESAASSCLSDCG